MWRALGGGARGACPSQEKAPVAQRLRHVVAQQPAERRQQPGERLEVDPPAPVLRQDRLPAEEVPQQPGELRRVPLAHRPGALRHDVAAQPDDPPAVLAVAVQRPLVAVAVEDVRNRREALELLPVAAAEAPPLGACPRRLQLHVPHQRAIAGHSEVRPAEAARQRGLPRTGGADSELGRHSRQQVLERRPQLLLGAARQRRRAFLGHRIREGANSGECNIGLGHDDACRADPAYAPSNGAPRPAPPCEGCSLTLPG